MNILHGQRCCTELIFQINVSSRDDVMNFDELCLAKPECINFESNWPHNSIQPYIFLLGFLNEENFVRSILADIRIYGRRKVPKKMAYKIVCTVQYVFPFNKFQMRVFCFFPRYDQIHSFIHSISKN